LADCPQALDNKLTLSKTPKTAPTVRLFIKITLQKNRHFRFDILAPTYSRATQP